MSTDKSLRPTRAFSRAHGQPQGIQLPSPAQCAWARERMLNRRRTRFVWAKSGGTK